MRTVLLVAAGLVVAALVLFGLLQLVPYGHNHINPPVVAEPAWDSPQTRDSAKRACFDCHSHETVWPWYSNVAPVSWLIQHDVDEGRQHLNFSDWNQARGESRREAGEAVAEGEMPPWYYVVMHPTANLSDAETQQLINGLSAIR